MESAPPITSAAELLRPLIRGDLRGLPEVAARHGVLLVVLFGSTARGRRRPESDLDLAVLFGPAADPADEREERLAGDLDELLRPACELTLVALNRAPELLRKEVGETGIVLYEDEPDRWLRYRIQANRAFELTEKFRRRRWDWLRSRYGLP